ncbi:hypothetical protein MRX96_005303 [Rhipicephalus microplus]
MVYLGRGVRCSPASLSSRSVGTRPAAIAAPLVNILKWRQFPIKRSAPDGGAPTHACCARHAGCPPRGDYWLCNPSATARFIRGGQEILRASFSVARLVAASRIERRRSLGARPTNALGRRCSLRCPNKREDNDGSFAALSAFRPCCTVDGRQYAEGDVVPSYERDPCVVCLCKGGRVTCTKKSCPVLPCPPSRIAQTPGTCCPECRSLLAGTSRRRRCCSLAERAKWRGLLCKAVASPVAAAWRGEGRRHFANYAEKYATDPASEMSCLAVPANHPFAAQLASDPL